MASDVGVHILCTLEEGQLDPQRLKGAMRQALEQFMAHTDCLVEDIVVSVEIEELPNG